MQEGTVWIIFLVETINRIGQYPNDVVFDGSFTIHFKKLLTINRQNCRSVSPSHVSNHTFIIGSDDHVFCFAYVQRSIVESDQREHFFSAIFFRERQGTN